MPEGTRGFQKGRDKTGGRKKESVQRVKSFIELMKGVGFNYPKELADALRDLPLGSGPAGTKYTELMRLLPYMAPRLNEREIDVIDPTTEPAANAAPISDEAILESLKNAKPKQSGGGRGSVAPGNPSLEIPRGSEAHLSDVVGEQEAD